MSMQNAAMSTQNPQNPRSASQPHSVVLTQLHVDAYSSALLEYGLYLLNYPSPSASQSKHYSLKNKESSTLETKNHNICINPLQLLRAWALLFTFACGKTRKAMDGFLRNITSNLLGKDESIHEVLSALNAPLTECAQCIQIFCDQQPAVPVNGNVLQEIKRFYGSARTPTPFSEMNFSGDEDGLASIGRINAEAERSSGKLLNFVVREENGPNRRTRLVLVSAVDCTFYWDFDGKQGPLTKCSFCSVNGKEYLYAWPCEGEFRCSCSNEEFLLELDSQVEGYNLYLYRCKQPDLSAKAFIQAVDSLPARKTQKKVCVPRIFVSYPLRLSEFLKNKDKFGLKRIFDSEKSDLSGIFYRSHRFYPYFVTLWEHYHKAKFTITTSEPEATEKSTKKQAVGKMFGISVEERVLKQQKLEGRSKRDSKEEFRRYYEFEEAEVKMDEKKEDPKALDSYLKFDKPFYYMVVKKGEFGRMINCIGRFNSAAAM